jgi:predicted signal transduction protein with EAL and GGDEF domain
MLGAPYVIRGDQIVVGVSIGIAVSEPSVTGTELLMRADLALYRAKKERGTFAFFEVGMDEHPWTRRKLEGDLQFALQRDKFAVHFQPVFIYAESRVTGVEALLRWTSPARGSVSPGDFIPVAEQSGLIVPIGEFVPRTACRDATQWPDHVRVAVNVSAVQTRGQRLLALVQETLTATGLPARRLELEITETAFQKDTDAVLEMLNGLHEIGVRVSMDDFGTGYSSLGYLRRFPFDNIKIDRSFVGDLGNLPEAAASGPAKNAATIIRAITNLGANLAISTIAKGSRRKRNSPMCATAAARSPGLLRESAAPGVRGRGAVGTDRYEPRRFGQADQHGGACRGLTGRITVSSSNRIRFAAPSRSSYWPVRNDHMKNARPQAAMPRLTTSRNRIIVMVSHPCADAGCSS